MSRRSVLLLSATAPIALAGAIFGATPAVAQTAAVVEQQREFSIPAGRLSQSVLALSEQADVQVVFDSDTTGSVEGNAVSGTLILKQALDRLLSGTGLRWRWLRAGVVTIEGASADGERVTTAVRVEGSQGSPYFGGAGKMAGVNGINGSRDITATEGTKSFTSGALTIGSKVPQAMKDVPQSISVLTSERLEQQNITDFSSAMRQLPGITLVQGSSSMEFNFYSRGFAVNKIQIDGGSPLTVENGYIPLFDMSVFDHVELLRGANGVFDGYGDPSGTVNLVRKKPLDHSQVLLEVQAGSWNSYRAMLDASTPLAFDGKLRGRLVMTYQNNDYFYDIAEDNKTLLYGIVEMDVAPKTLLRAGINHNRQDSVPWYGGLPRYETGEDLELPRSTALIMPWSRWNFETTEVFGGVEQGLGRDWTLKLNLTHNSQRSTRKIGWGVGTVSTLTGMGPAVRSNYTDLGADHLSAEAVLAGAFTIFGQRQEIVVGVNRMKTDAGGAANYTDPVTSSAAAPYQPYPGGPRYCYSPYGSPCPAGTIGPSTPPIDVFNFDPDDPIYTEPQDPLPYRRFLTLGSVQTGAFINLRLTAFDRLHLTTGLRWSHYDYKSDEESICRDIPETEPSYSPNCFGREVGDAYRRTTRTYKESNIDWPPSANASFDITNDLTAYAGYSDIFISQANMVDGNLDPLPPITGSNVEAGLKWAPRDGKLNLTIAAYQIKQKGMGLFDPDEPYQQLGGGVTCCYRVDPDRAYKSRGIDLEGTGEILPGWQIAASLNLNKNKRTGSSFGSSEGKPLVSIQPERLYKLWTSYDFGAAGASSPLSGLTLSGGVNGQSSAYYAGSVCLNPGPPNPVTGQSPCKSYSPPDNVPFEFTVPAHAVVSARVDYRLSPAWSFALNVENLFDKVYYQTTGSFVSGGNWYGAPRSFTATLRAKW